MREISLFVFRRDLRLKDNTGLNQALASSNEVVPLFVLDTGLLSRWQGASFRLSFLADALKTLDQSLRRKGGRLLVEQGNPEQVIASVAKRMGAGTVHVNRDYSPYARNRDQKTANLLAGAGITFETHADQCLQEPEAVLKRDGTPYKIFTPFYKVASTIPVRAPAGLSKGTFVSLADEPVRLPVLNVVSDDVLGPGKLKKRVAAMEDYVKSREIPSEDGTSKLSSYLRFGLVSPRTVYAWAGQLQEPEAFRRQLYWRDFYHHIGWHFPHVYKGCFRRQYDAVRWIRDVPGFEA